MGSAPLEIRQTDSELSFDLWANGSRVGSLWWSARDDEDPEDFQEGWCAEVAAGYSDNCPDIKDAVAAAHVLYADHLEHERKMRKIDRNRPRTVSIPSGGQPR